MPDYKSQEFLFQRIKELLTPETSLVDTVAGILHISNDSAYRRIRCETPMVLDEVRDLCTHFKFSLDQLLNVQSGATLFQNVRINLENYSYEKYLSDLTKRVEQVGGFTHNNIIYLTKDVPLFHNFYFTPLIAFRYYFWMKSILCHPDFDDRKFNFNCLTPEVERLSRELAMAYNKVPSTEIWNTECINAVISQIEFYKDSGLFTSPADIIKIYESLEQTLLHLKTEVEYGAKFMPNENPDSKKQNFRFLYNRIMLGDNTVLVETDRVKTAFINYDVLNYMVTTDENFCTPRFEDIQKLIQRSTLISQTSEKQRNVFFNIMLNKVSERKRVLT